MTGAPRPDSLRLTGPPPPELAVACPHCHAPPGARCTTRKGRTLHIPYHDARHHTHQQQQETQT
jgi:hypothetical protein